MLPFPKSQVWRFDWAYRTCLSVLVISIIAVFYTSDKFLSPDSLIFSVFMTVLVKDVTYGGTLANCWYCIFGSFTASLFCWIFRMLLDFGRHQHDWYNQITPFIIFVEFLFVFIFQYLELPVMGKKLAVSIIAVDLLSFELNPAIAIWQLFCGVLLGCAVGLVGTLLPYPNIASKEVRERINYGTLSISTLLEDSILYWMLHSCMGSTSISIIDDETSNDNTPTSQFASFGGMSMKINFNKRPNKHWRMLRLSIHAMSRWKRTKNSGIGFFQHHSSRASHFLRVEIVKFLENSLQVIIARNLEARFGPNRGVVVSQYGKYVKLLQDLLSIASLMESSIDSLQRNDEYAAVYKSFFMQPEFRRKLFVLFDSISLCLESISILLLHMHENAEQRHLQSVDIIMRLSQMHLARIEFDSQYLICRKALYYYESIGIDNESNARRQSEVDKAPKPNQLPVFPEVLMQMNSFLFLIDTICQLETMFMSFDDMILIAKESLSPSAHTFNKDWFSESINSTIAALINDLFPSQWHLFSWILKVRDCGIPASIMIRIKASFSLALSMSIAGVYGIYATRPQPFLASFTIAYLAGGPATGASIVTSLNRSFGTAVACVYAIIIVFIIKAWTSTVGKSLFLIAAVVLFQFPATYVRSYPLSGYSGTVAGFTAAILLLAKHSDVDSAVNRIIDTYVGVGIYLIVELSTNARFTEEILLSNIGTVFEGFTEIFHQFYDNLCSFSDSTSHRIKISSSNVSIASLRIGIERQRLLMMFSSAEPSVFKPPAFPPQLYEDIVLYQERALHSLQMMLWAVQSPSDWYCVTNKESAVQLLAEFLSSQQHDVNGDDSISGSRSTIIADLEKLKRISKAPSLETNRSVQGSSFSIIVEAIQPHYVDVYNSLSSTMISLSHVLNSIKTGDVFNQSPPMGIGGVGLYSEKYRRAYHQITAFHHRYNKLEDFVISSNNLHSIVQNYLDLIVKIRASVITNRSKQFFSFEDDENKNTEDGDELEILSNREMKVINSVLVSTKDLLSSLEGLLSVVRRMQAHRVIHLQQDGRKL